LFGLVQGRLEILLLREVPLVPHQEVPLRLDLPPHPGGVVAGDVPGLVNGYRRDEQEPAGRPHLGLFFWGVRARSGIPLAQEAAGVVERLLVLDQALSQELHEFAHCSPSGSRPAPAARSARVRSLVACSARASAPAYQDENRSRVLPRSANAASATWSVSVSRRRAASRWPAARRYSTAARMAVRVPWRRPVR